MSTASKSKEGLREVDWRDAPLGLSPSQHKRAAGLDHEVDEIVLVVEGQAAVIIDDQATVLAPGMLMVIPAGVSAELRVIGGTRTIHILRGYCS